MPVIDMPLEKMREYMGTNPRPADFDEFWENSIKEMNELDPKVEYIPSNFRCPFAECYDMFFTGTFESRIHAKFVKPKKINGKAPAILMFHGYCNNCGDWTRLLPYAASGFIAVSLDCRGQGGISEDKCQIFGNTLNGFITKGLLDTPDKMYYRNQFLDTALLAKIIMALPEVDENRVGAHGKIQGGGLTVACAALEPRIALAAPVYPFLGDYKRVWDMDLDDASYHDLRDFFRWYDPLHEKETEYFTKLGYTDIQFLAPRIKAKVEMFTGLLDNIVPPSTQFAVYNRMQCEKNIHIFPDFGHEVLHTCDDMIYRIMLELL